MLANQGALAFELWTREEALTEIVFYSLLVVY